MAMEDYTGKFEFALWSEDYLRFINYMKAGICLFVNAGFKPRRFNENEYEFKVQSIQLLQEVKKTHTRQVALVTMPKFLTPEIVQFLSKNAAENPGKAELYVQLIDRDDNLSIRMHTVNKHIEMNDDLAHFLQKQPDIDVYIDTINK
ncbi:hypothetical protein MKQ70_05530 [Chitinophaga sedimenti]|uniref:hypothetical protein n=1 Tax=Chitinophaga sedimenti TaxID=2033606 RepID=UPI0020049A5A|nr:hypothetical protein [Chitinophaga sedimenti]MCK7554493.1 hypothetical protein [Chitinophaga sedimenti]